VTVTPPTTLPPVTPPITPPVTPPPVTPPTMPPVTPPGGAGGGSSTGNNAATAASLGTGTGPSHVHPGARLGKHALTIKAMAVAATPVGTPTFLHGRFILTFNGGNSTLPPTL
jgi:hypothetical protein